MTRERLYLFDTTLRDGQQTQGVDFSLEDKARIAAAPQPRAVPGVPANPVPALRRDLRPRPRAGGPGSGPGRGNSGPAEVQP